MIKPLLAALVLAAASFSTAMPAGSRVTLPTGKKIFVSGMNLAWITYAGDVGNTPLSSSSIAKIDAALKAVHDSGGNTMRIWLSTDGTNDPIYTNGYVSGPGTSTIANIQTMLQLAKKNSMLLVPVLLTHNWVNKSINATILANNKTMLTTDSGLSAYLKNYLKPVVSAIGNDPNLLCWEVFNEPEGMVDGWSSPANTITKAQVQKAVNRIAGTIHTLVPGVLVSNGAATAGTLSWYSDANLKAAGGDTAGKLDFYMAHYYGWNGTSNSPFTKAYAGWNLDKPLVIGEYASSDWSQSTASSSTMQDAGKVDTLLRYLDNAGYAGGMGWQYQPDAGDPWMKGFATFGHSIRLAYLNDSSSIKLSGTSNGTFSVSVAAGVGGSVTASPTGRIDSTKSVTLTAVPATGYTFTGWSGDTTAAAAALTIPSVIKDWSLTANFTPDAGTNLLKEGDFATSTSWGFYAAKGNTASVSYATGKAVVTVSSQDDTTYHVQLTQSGLSLTKGTTYLLSFQASASAARSIAIDLSSGAPDWTWLGGSTASLTTTTSTYTLELTPSATAPAATLQFNLGGATGTVTLDNVSLVKKDGGTGIAAISHNRGASMTTSLRGGLLAWSLPSALSSNGTLRILDVQGRELSRTAVAAGSRSGSLGLSGQGLRFLVLESAGASYSVVLPALR